MKAIMIMFDSLNRHLLSAYGSEETITPNFRRLLDKCETYDNFYCGSMPCMPARREIHTGRYNFLHRPWGPLEGYDDSMPDILREHGIYTHLTTDHWHYWEEGGDGYHNSYSSYEAARGQEGDPWKGVVDFDRIPPHLDGRHDACGRQEYINRCFMRNEKDQSIAVTFQNGLDFIERNKTSDNWYLQIEAFDPHEPFFTQEKYKALYPDDYEGPQFDWPGYHPVRETKEQIEACRNAYKALLTQCDTWMGKVLDMMDENELWKDTLLIVNTDHGFLLSEHNWWGKLFMPYYNEIAHIPFFIHNPKNDRGGKRNSALSQTIDIAPTVLDFFGIEKTKDMLGHSLFSEEKREYALFGQFGLHVSITDGRYVYMRAPRREHQDELRNYMLTPHSYPGAVTPEVLRTMKLSAPFSFTKGISLPVYEGGWCVKIPGFPPDAMFDDGDLLFDLEKDPGQNHPFHDAELERKLSLEMIRLMRENEAPEEQYGRLGFVDDGLV